MSIPITIHPKNNKVFLFRDKPLVLVCATEHYGAVMNRPFDFEKYLADAMDKNQTLTRLFILFRELQSAINPHSTCKPESPDYISPYKRTGPGKALDGEKKYDLDQWNDEFFERLHRFLSLASDYGVIVEVTIFSNTYNESVWSLNPLNSLNNINDLEEINWSEYTTKRNPNLFQRQIELVKKIIKETNRYDNIIYEVCNEPGGGLPGKPKPEEINEWIASMIGIIRKIESNMPKKHLISGQESFIYSPMYKQPLNKSFNQLEYDVVNVHPLPNVIYGQRSYNMGEFMSKELKLREVKEFCLATIGEKKPVNLDEDNVASQYKDYDGWTIQRKRAWISLFCGCHYDYIDFSINNHLESGTPHSQKCIRSWMKYLSEFIHSIDLISSRSLIDRIKEKPANTIEAVLGIEGKEYCIYLADIRELEEKECGLPINGDIVINLPTGMYKVSCFSPVTLNSL